MKLTLKEFIQKEVGASYDIDTIFYNLESDQILEIIESYTKYVNNSPYKKKLYGYVIEFETTYTNEALGGIEKSFYTRWSSKIYDNKFIADQALDSIKRDSGKYFDDKKWIIKPLYEFVEDK